VAGRSNLFVLKLPGICQTKHVSWKLLYFSCHPPVSKTFNTVYSFFCFFFSAAILIRCTGWKLVKDGFSGKLQKQKCCYTSITMHLFVRHLLSQKHTPFGKPSRSCALPRLTTDRQTLSQGSSVKYRCPSICFSGKRCMFTSLHLSKVVVHMQTVIHDKYFKLWGRLCVTCRQSYGDPQLKLKHYLTCSAVLR